MVALVLAINAAVLGSVAAVYLGARGRDWSANRWAKSARMWAFGVLALWIVVLPLYLVQRRAAPLVREDAAADPEPSARPAAQGWDTSLSQAPPGA